MSTVSMAVRLRSPDPAAVTALATLRRVLPGEAPEELQRYERWEFNGSGVLQGTVTAIIDHFDDIVNPNKQTWTLLERGPLPGEDPDMVWCGIQVTDIEDSVSENWTSILRRRGYPLERVVHSILWRAGFPAGTPASEAVRKAKAIALTTGRDRGLLANPVSQTVTVTNPV